jgi:hypothetical protein
MINAMTRPGGGRAAVAGQRGAAPYGPNHTLVAGFIKAVVELTPIQWLRVLDRRRLVASVTREGSVEPVRVVRSILAAIEGTRGLDQSTRCRAFAAAERAGFAFESLDPADWRRIAAGAPDLHEESVAPLVNAGTALVDFLRDRSDDEVVTAWHGLSALVHRHRLTPIKFAASYAPFAPAIRVIGSRSLGAIASRYVTALGRLGASQCAVLAQPWRVDDELSTALSRAAAEGGSRAGEEAATLAALVTVPMRLAGTGGWAAVKTAAFGGRVIAARNRLTAEQLTALWAPIEPAIPLAILGARLGSRR